MPRYATRQPRATWGGYDFDEREPLGREVDDLPGDQPTGILDADGRMIYRIANSIGYLADN